MSSAILVSAIRAYCEWAESIREHDDMYRDDCALDEIRDNARVSRNALWSIHPYMHGLFSNICHSCLGKHFYPCTDFLVTDTGSGVYPENDRCFINGECIVNGSVYSFTIDNDGVTVLK